LTSFPPHKAFIPPSFGGGRLHINTASSNPFKVHEVASKKLGKELLLINFS